MKVLLDTNVVLDYLLKRKLYFKPAKLIFQWAFNGKISASISASAVTDIYYLIRKKESHSVALGFIKELIQFIDVAGVDRQAIISALQSDMTDFEDAVQNAVAIQTKREAIITRNLDDYKNSELKIYSPEKFVAYFK